MSITYITIPPPKHLSTYVRFFWVLESDLPYTHRQMADTSPEVIFHYEGQFDELTSTGERTPSFRSGIHGQARSSRRFTIDRGFGIFGVYLYPYAIPVLLDMEASELTGQMPDLSTLWNNEGRLLQEKMITARDNQARRQIVTDFLTNKLEAKSEAHPAIFNAVKHTLETRGQKTVASLAAQCGLSERQFGRTFKRYAGFSPKLFSRIARFHAATNHYGNTDDRSLTQVALDCGYYDQSHFIQDFKEFAGCLPSDFFAGEAEGMAWRDG